MCTYINYIITFPICYIVLCFTESGQALKYISLITLTLQNALVGLSMRYARTRSGDMFLSSTGTLYLFIQIILLS